MGRSDSLILLAVLEKIADILLAIPDLPGVLTRAVESFRRSRSHVGNLRQLGKSAEVRLIVLLQIYHVSEEDDAVTFFGWRRNPSLSQLPLIAEARYRECFHACQADLEVGELLQQRKRLGVGEVELALTGSRSIRSRTRPP